MSTIGAQTSATTPLSDSDLLVMEQGGSTKKITYATFRPKIFASALSASLAQSIPDNAVTTVTYDTEDLDTDAMGDTANNRIVIQTAGTYLLGTANGWAGNNTGQRYVGISVNGTVVADDRRQGLSGSDSTVTTKPLELSVNDVVTVSVLQQSGAALDLNTSVAWAVRI